MSKSKLFNNTLLSFGGKCIAMMIYMLLDIIIARALSIDNYAEWTFYFTIVNMMYSIGWMGINTSSKVYISKQNDELNQVTHFKVALKLRLLVSAILALIIFLFSCFGFKSNVFEYRYPDFKYMIFFMGGMVFFNSLVEFFKDISIGLNKFKNLFCITVLENGLYLIWVLIFISIYSNPISVSAGYTLSGVSIIAICLYMYRQYRAKRIPCDVNEKEIRNKIFKYAMPIAVMGLGSIILLEMDTLMLGILSTNEQLSVYSIAKQLCAKAAHVNYALTTGVMTTFSVINAANIDEKMIKFKKVSAINLLITLLIFTILFFAMPEIVVTLYGAKYMSIKPVLRVLAFYYVLYGVSNFYGTFLDFHEKAGFRSICYCCMIVINFIFNILLIPKYGARGAAYASFMALIPYTIVSYLESIKCFKIK